VSFVTAKNVGFKPAPGKAAATNTRVILLAEQTIIVTGSKGGAGTTTVALNVAMQIAQLTKKRTALVELARPFGQIALMLDIEPRFTLLDALDRGERLDAAVLASLMTRHKIGVEMLLGARHLALTADQRQRATIDGLLHILETAQSVYDFVVVDLGFVNAAEWRGCSMLRARCCWFRSPASWRWG
jgi:pilus assembly protein CpaE